MKVDKPVTFKPPASTLIPPLSTSTPFVKTRIPARAVIKPIASTFVTSSYVSVPPIDTLLLNLTSLVKVVNPVNFELPLTSNNSSG